MRTAPLRAGMLSLSLAFLLAVYALAGSRAGAASYSISGTVKNMSTMQGIAGATVTVTNSQKQAVGTTVTNGSGQFSVSVPGTGVYSLSAAEAGYALFGGPGVAPVGTFAPNYTGCVIYMSQTSSLALKAGWNFISLAKAPSDTSIGTVLAGVLSDVQIVWAFDNAAKQWLRYAPLATDNSLSVMEPGLGYWIYANQDTSINTTGWLPNSGPTAHLYTGWNLVGYGDTDDASVSTALSRIPGKWSILWTWDSNQWYAKDAAIPSLSVSPLANLHQGKAYWLLATDDANWFQAAVVNGAEWVRESTPADSATQVTPATGLDLRMWNAIDGSTVNSSTLAVSATGEYGTISVSGSVSYNDALRTFTYQHAASLQTGSTYTITLNEGLKDTLGNTLSDTYTCSFSTMKNQIKQYVDYNLDGTVNDYGVYTFDGSGNVAQHINYGGPGTDGAWFTADDAIAYYETFTPSALGVVSGDGRCDDPGPDGIWFTSDDLVLSFSYTYDYLHGNRRQLNSYGDFQLEYSYDAAGFLTQVAYGYPAGTDAGRYVSYKKILYTGGVKAQEISYTDPGPDNQWFTADDLVDWGVTYTYDNNGLLAKSTICTGGADASGACLGGRLSSYRTYTYGANGLVAQSAWYRDPGPDMKWFTADDMVFEYTTYTYDQLGRKVGSVLYNSSGADNQWFTADDGALTVNTYDTTW